MSYFRYNHPAVCEFGFQAQVFVKDMPIPMPTACHDVPIPKSQIISITGESILLSIFWGPVYLYGMFIGVAT